jgi:hypothetical protein
MKNYTLDIYEYVWEIQGSWNVVAAMIIVIYPVVTLQHFLF